MTSWVNKSWMVNGRERKRGRERVSGQLIQVGLSNMVKEEVIEKDKCQVNKERE